MTHDPLFKDVLRAFFPDFLRRFFPAVTGRLDFRGRPSASYSARLAATGGSASATCRPKIRIL